MGDEMLQLDAGRNEHTGSIVQVLAQGKNRREQKAIWYDYQTPDRIKPARRFELQQKPIDWPFCFGLR